MDNNIDIKSMFGSSLFWDAEEIDIEKNAAYVIARVLDYGDIEDVKMLRKLYPDYKIAEVVKKRKGLFPQTGKYWALKLGIPFNEVACLKKYYTPRQ